jgi:hypothetical protein
MESFQKLIEGFVLQLFKMPAILKMAAELGDR